jgi:hypothetical protein
MRQFIAIAATLSIFLAAPAVAQMRADEITQNPTCAPKFKVCPDGSFMAPIGAKCEIPPCGGYPPPPDPYAPPPGASGHYKVPVKPGNKPGVATPPPIVNTCNKDVFTCPDGTQVVRIPPMCNFARCPATEDPVEEQEDTPPEEGTESQEEPVDETGEQ